MLSEKRPAGQRCRAGIAPPTIGRVLSEHRHTGRGRPRCSRSTLPATGPHGAFLEILPPHPGRRTDMSQHPRITPAILILALNLFPAFPALAQTAKLVERPPDPHGSPRPFRDAKEV